MTNILYSTGCPKCKVLEKKLNNAGIPYEVVSDIDIITSKGFDTVPVLSVLGKTMDFSEAIKWINNKE